MGNGTRTSRRVTVTAAVFLGLLAVSVVPWRIGPNIPVGKPAYASESPYTSLEAVTISGKTGLVLGRSTADDIRRIMGKPDDYSNPIEKTSATPGNPPDYYGMIYRKANVRFYLEYGTLVSIEVQGPSYSYRGITVGSSLADLHGLIGKPKAFVDYEYDPVADRGRLVSESGNGKPVEERFHTTGNQVWLGYRIPEWSADFVVKDGRVWSIIRDVRKPRSSGYNPTAVGLSLLNCGEHTVWNAAGSLGDPLAYVDENGGRMKMKRAEAMAAGALTMEYPACEIRVNHGVIQQIDINLAGAGAKVPGYSTHGVGAGTTLEDTFALVGKPELAIGGDPDSTPIDGRSTLFTWRSADGTGMKAYRVPKYGMLVWYDDTGAYRIRRFIPVK